jgi:hypothetical protein
MEYNEGMAAAKNTCLICESRISTFTFREGTRQERGICNVCLEERFQGNVDGFLVYVYGSTNGAVALIPAPDPPKDIPEGEILIALWAPSFKQPVAGLYRIIVSTPQTLAAESYDVRVTL